MAKIKSANTNELSTEVVKRMQEADANRIEQERAYQAETDSVCSMIHRCRREREHPEIYSTDTMVELVARVPARVAESAVRDIRFKDKYPCITSYAFGLLSGLAVAAVTVFMVVML